jgi:DNA-binding CsgD family transcriptional regulator
MDQVIRACYAAGDDLPTLRHRFLRALERAVPFDAAFFATADPESLVFTSAFADDTLAASGPLFLDNEYAPQHDVNRFVDLAHAADPVASLDHVTGGQRGASVRWREVMHPLGLGDEARTAFRVDATSWGFLCLHRSGDTGFSTRELGTLRKLAPHAGVAIRRLVATSVDAPSVAGDPRQPTQAVVLVAEQRVLAVAGATDMIEDVPVVVGDPPPMPLMAVVRRLEAIESGAVDGPPAAVRLTALNGTVVSVHAARLVDGSGNGPVALTLTPAASAERSSLLLAAHGLTPAQRRVAELVLQGRTTAQIVVDLHISAHTVQDHLKVVFDKIGVRSRRELVGALLWRTTG